MIDERCKQQLEYCIQGISYSPFCERAIATLKAKCDGRPEDFQRKLASFTVNLFRIKLIDALGLDIGNVRYNSPFPEEPEKE